MVALAVAMAGLLAAPRVDAGLVRPMQSRPGPGEYDTADRGGGQAGGIGLGRGYVLKTLRCDAGESIVGVRLRRGDVLDYLQIACSTPSCDGSKGLCRTGGVRWGASAGNPGGGDASPPMLCGSGEVLTGFRARVVTFTSFDYAADLEIECARMAGVAPGAKGLVRLDQSPAHWVESEEGLDGGGPGNAVRNQVTGRITCRPNGGAAAISVGESDFVRQGQRIVQAISLYCPSAPPKEEERPSDVDQMIDALDACMHEEGGLDYYARPQFVPYSGRVTYDGANGTIRYDRAFLDRQTPYVRAFWLANALGAHALALERQRYGNIRSDREAMGAADYIGGYLAHCLRLRNLLPKVGNNSPDDPRNQYERFLGTFSLPGDPPGFARTVVDWDRGWLAYGMGFPSTLRHN